MNIPEEAIEKAARAMTSAVWGELDPVTAGDLVAARAALSAAAPLLMAQAWEEARDAYREDVSKGDVWRRNPYRTKEQP